MDTGTEAALLEREGELQVVAGELAAAGEGRGGVVLLQAAAGLGKTSVLRAAQATAEASGLRWLRARAGELERDFAYGCVRQLLEPTVRRAGEAERARLLAGPAAPAASLFPGIDAPAAPGGDTSFAVLDALYWLVDNLAAEGPVVLAVDDLHWADPESLRFLTYLAPRLDGLPLVVLATTRDGQYLTTDLARLAAAPETRALRLRPLSPEGTATLCERVLGTEASPDFVAACRQATGGNPFFLGALLREASDQGFATDAGGADQVRHIGPAAVAQAVLLRLSGAPAAATAVVRAAAVLGDGAALAEVAALAGLPHDEVTRAADLLVGLAVLRPADGVEFAHSIVREAVYADIDPHARAVEHGRAADVLAAAGAAGERVAAQLLEAAPAGDAGRARLLRRVAAEALARGAPAAAATWAARALAEPPPDDERPAVLAELGTAELRLGRPESIEHLAAAARSRRDPGALGPTVRRLALALTVAGRSDAAVSAIEDALPAVESADREWGLVLAADLHAHAQQADPAGRPAAAERIGRWAGLTGATPGERLVVACQAFEAARAATTDAEAVAHLTRGLAGGTLLAEQDLDVAGCVFHLIIGLLSTEGLDVAERALDQALDDARARSSVPALAFVTHYRGRVALRRGAVAQAAVAAHTAVDLLAERGVVMGSATVRSLLVEALVVSGDLDGAQRALDAGAGGADPELAPVLTDNPFLEARAALRLAQNRPQEALDDLREFGRRDEAWGGANPLASRWRSSAALAAHALGDTATARALADDDLARARAWGSAGGIGVALRASALLERGDEAVAQLDRAVASLAASPFRLDHARALADLGAALRRANRRAEARPRLLEALDLAVHCGATALAESARTELRAAGGRTTDPYGTGLQQLTASELRVAELASQGQSNPQIAQALFVTRKTVETHLGHVYRKLSVPGRTQLAAAMSGPVS